MQKLELITPPAELPVSTDQLRGHLWTIYPEKTTDDYLTLLIKAAVSHIESITWRRLISQTWRLYLDAWPDVSIMLPYGVVSSIESVRWLDSGGTDHLLTDGTDYLSAVNGAEPQVLPVDHWPTGELFDVDSIRVDFVAGFGGADDVPADLRHAILMLAAHWYETREAVIVGTTVRKVPFAVDALVAPWKIRLE